MSTPDLQNLFLAAALAGGIAALAALLRMLTFSGALAAFAVGFFVFGLGGLPFAVPLVAFFLTSSLLSLFRQKVRPSAEHEAKGARRDAAQVLANGAIPAVLAVRFAVSQEYRQTLLLFLAALAAVTADTWATEIGGLFPFRPRLLSTFRAVPHGTSGAVSLFGTLAAIAGAAFIAWIGYVVWPARTAALLWRPDAAELLAVGWAGFLAAYVDSLLGATVQAHYRCVRCELTIDRNEHCGVPAERLRGIKWFTNDAVNLAASVSGILFAWIFLRYYAYPL